MMFLVRYAASFTLALSLFSHAQSLVRGDPAKPCYPGICKLLDCFCSGTEIPGNLSVSSIPQIVFISFDAFVNSAPLFYYETLFDGSLKNPNGCNISATFFASHEYTNYCEVQDLYWVNVTKSGIIRYLAYYPLIMVGKRYPRRTERGNIRDEGHSEKMGKREGWRCKGLPGSIHPSRWKHGV